MLWPLWIAALIFKIALLPYLPITPDETYYFAWSRHLQLSYFDHPPFVAWIMWFGGFFWKTSFGARVPGVIFEHLGMIPWIVLLKKLNFSKKMITVWLFAILVGPMTGLGSFIITPDVPLIFFWGLALLALHEVIKKPIAINWICLGLVFGLGMISKYTMVLFLPGILILYFAENKIYLLKDKKAWLALALSFFVFLPVLIWNAQNGFASFRFQSSHGLGGSGAFHLKWTMEYLLGQIGLLNPLIAGLCAIAIFRSHKRQRLLTVFGLLPLGFFLLTSTRARVEANWPICGYPALTALAVWGASTSRPLWRTLKGALLISTVFFISVLSHAMHPWLPIKPEMDRTSILREWKDDVPVLQKFSPLYGRSYQVAAYHSYFRPADKEVVKPAGLDRKDFYDFLKQPNSLAPGYIVLDAQDIIYEKLEKNYSLNVVQSLPSGLVLYEVRSQ